MKISKFIGKSFAINPFHSSGYAREAQGRRIGSTSGESFNQRLNIHKNRQVVGTYREAAVNQNRSFDDNRRQLQPEIRVDSSDVDNTNTLSEKTNSTGNRQPRSPATQRIIFREPNSRKYDPFA